MSYLDSLLVAAAGQLKASAIVAGGQSAAAVPGQLVLCDSTSGTITVSAPPGPSGPTFFGVADVSGASPTHAITVSSTGSAYMLEDPNSPGTYSASVQINVASRVRYWVYVGTAWKLVQGVN